MNSIPSVEVDSSDHVAKTTKTTCPYCGVGCGVSVNVQQKPQGPVVQVEGMLSILPTLDAYVLKVAVLRILWG